MSYADDLEDGLEYEVDEMTSIDNGISVEDDEHGDTVTSKRPLESEDEEENLQEVGVDVESEEKPLSKRQKKLAKSKLHLKKMERMEYESAQKKNLSKSNTETIVDYLATLIRDKNPDLSALELDELYFKKQDFLSTERFDKERNLDNFQEFVNTFSKSPRAIIISLSNIRVADVYRSVSGSKSAVKLFSKNKLKDDIARVEMTLGTGPASAKDDSSKKKDDSKKRNKNKQKGNNGSSSEPVRYFISTPGRLSKIIEGTDLLFKGKEKLDIILDTTYLDPKKNSIFTSDDGMVLCKVLKQFLKNKSSVKILLY